MIDKIPIKTLLDHAKQPFIPYTTAKSVMWDGTDKTLYDVVMEGVPVPEASTEAMPTFLIKDNSSVNPLVLCDCKPGIYLKPSPTSGAITWWLAGESGATAKQIYTSNQGIFVTEQPTPETINSTVFYQNNNLVSCVLNYSSSKRLTESTLNRPEYLMNSSGTSTLLYSQVMFNKIPTFASNLTPAADADVVNKGYVDGAITSAIEENNTDLNADILVAINAAARAEHAAENVNMLQNRYTTRPTDANITTEGNGGLVKYLSTSAMTSNRPSNDGHIIHMFWDTTAGWDSQLFIGNGLTPSVRVRGQDLGNWGDWIELARQSAVDAKQNKVTYGTGDPSGGSDGDVYFKYTA